MEGGARSSRVRHCCVPFCLVGSCQPMQGRNLTMLRDFTKDQLIEIAKAIEGPHDIDGHYDNDKKQLQTLRLHKWRMLTDQGRGVRLVEALSACITMTKIMK